MPRTANGGMRTDLAVIKVQLESMSRQLQSLDTEVKAGYVSQAEFRPVRNVVFGFLSFALIAMLGVVGASVVYFLKSGAPT